MISSPKMPQKVAVVFQEVEDELVAFSNNKEVFNFNSSARLVWQSCDGETLVSEVAEHLEEEFSLFPGEGLPVVWTAIRRFQKLDLVENYDLVPDNKAFSSRRRFLKSFASSAAAVPIILVAGMPSPAQAVSGFVDCGTSCNTTCVSIAMGADPAVACAVAAGGFPECATECPGECFNSPGCTGMADPVTNCVACVTVPNNSFLITS